MITSAIGSHEGRYVSKIYIPGSYLHMDSDEELIMMLKGKLSELILNIDPNLYRKRVLIEEVVNMIYPKFTNITTWVTAQRTCSRKNRNRWGCTSHGRGAKTYTGTK